MTAPTFFVTFFDNRSASHKREQKFTMAELLPLIERTTADEKDKLPWLKLARLGEIKTPIVTRPDGRRTGGSLRHDANVQWITGVEGDVDVEIMKVEEAIERVTKVGMAAIVYTSPSHTEGAPRFRVLCPTSLELPPQWRAHLVGRLNGLLGGLLSKESFTLSQSYYFGSVKGNPLHMARVIEGTCIDLLDQLDESWIGKANGSKAPASVARPVIASRPDQITDKRLKGLIDKLLGNLRSAPEGSKHIRLLAIARTVGGYAHLLPYTEPELIDLLMAALPDSVADWTKARRTALDGFRHGVASPITLEERSLRAPCHLGSGPGIDAPVNDLEAPARGTGGEATLEWLVAEPFKVEADATDTAAECIATLNRQYAVINEAGKVLVYKQVFDAMLGRQRYDRLSFNDFRNLFMNERIAIKVGKKIAYRNIAELWLGHKDRRQFVNGIVFDPSGALRQGTLNLWKGFAVKPAPGDCSLMKAHMLEVLCAGNQQHYGYLMDWCARLVQRLAEHGHVAIVLRGPEGAGKGIFVAALLRIFGQHGMQIANARHLVGNFNGHLRDVVLLFADEAFYAGDRQHTGVLKALITETTITIEAKFQNTITTPSFLHLIMASNNDWVIPASIEARRFAVFDVAEHRVKDYGYFAAIAEQMEHGGDAAMLAELLDRDIARFNVRDIPDTPGLQEQKKLSLPVFETWWRDVLHRGYIFRSRLGLEDYFGRWHEMVTTELLYASYAEFAERQRERHWLSREDFGKRLRKLGARPTRPKRGVIGEHITEASTGFGHTARVAEKIEKDNPMGYRLGVLTEAREAFTRAIGVQTDWQDDAT
jgi:hypothetical protein